MKMIQEKISALLAHESSVVFGYLFGSYARGEADARSDVDIAVYLQDDLLDMQLRLHHKLQISLQKEVDLLVLNNTRNIYLLESILDEGKVVKEAPFRAEFEVMAHLKILDFKAFKRYIDAA